MLTGKHITTELVELAFGAASHVSLGYACPERIARRAMLWRPPRGGVSGGHTSRTRSATAMRRSSSLPVIDKAAMVRLLLLILGHRAYSWRPRFSPVGTGLPTGSGTWARSSRPHKQTSQ